MRIRKFLADTLAMVLFSFVVGMGIEILISGLTFHQSFKSRLASIPLNLLTARPYGVWQDWIRKKLKAENGGRFRKGMIDTFAFLLFQVPLYFIILILSGAKLQQALIACGTVTILSTFMGRPYGMFLDVVRKIFQVH